MKKQLAILFVFISATAALATPPSSMELTYKTETKTLHVSAKHPSTYMEKHFLRRLVIFKNGVETQTSILNHQRFPAGIEEDIVFLANPGDTIAVEAYCSKGGTGKAEYTIPKVEETKKK